VGEPTDHYKKKRRTRLKLQAASNKLIQFKCFLAIGHGEIEWSLIGAGTNQ